MGRSRSSRGATRSASSTRRTTPRRREPCLRSCTTTIRARAIPSRAARAFPVVLLSQEEGLQLRALLARGAVAVDVRGIAQSPFRYDLVFPYSVVPAALRQTVTDANVATI